MIKESGAISLFRTTLEQTAITPASSCRPSSSRSSARKRPPLLVDLEGCRYQTTAGVIGGKQMVNVSAAVPSRCLLVTLTRANAPQPMNVPADLAAALAANKSARAFFTTLPNSLQRLHVDNINAAKSPETRQRRIDKSINLFLDGKKR